MPKIPLQFSGGQDQEQNKNSVASGRQALNIYPQKSSSGEVILKNAHGFAGEEITTLLTGDIRGAISVENLIYVVVADTPGSSAATFYEIDPNGPSISIKGTMTTSTEVIIMATNGNSIVMLTRGASDYYYIIGGALGTIQSLDADYTSYGQANDVAYYNGYYFFTTSQVIFHGDQKDAGNDGLSFDPLSFAPLPFVTNSGKGLAEYNGQIYVFGTNKTVIYNFVGTTPFILQQQVGIEIDVGIVAAEYKTKIGGSIYLAGYGGSSEVGVYKLSGISFEPIGYDSIFRQTSVVTEGFDQGGLYSYMSDSDEILWVKQSKFGDLDALNLTQSAAIGKKEWYQVGGFDVVTNQPNSRDFIKTIPLFVDFSISGATTLARAARVYFVSKGNTDTNIYLSQHDPDYTDIPSAMLGTSGDDELKFIHTFEYVRSGSEPVIVKNIRFKLIDSGMTAELKYSDGTNNLGGTSTADFEYESMGEIVPTTNGVVEWRRIGRIPTQRAFQLVLTNPNNVGLRESVSGGVVSGEIEI